jgi:hypothetical protein
MAEYYDFVLGLIPLAMGGTAALLGLLGVGFSLAVPAGAFVALPLLGHAMFVRAPGVQSPSEPATGSESRRHHSHSGPANSAD